ncbi:MAG: hypothetical protein ACXVIS_05920 [Halobacteriota archaeon]
MLNSSDPSRLIEEAIDVIENKRAILRQGDVKAQNASEGII